MLSFIINTIIIRIISTQVYNFTVGIHRMGQLTPCEGVINSEAAQDFIHIPGMKEAISPHDNLEWLCRRRKLIVFSEIVFYMRIKIKQAVSKSWYFCSCFVKYDDS